MSEEITVSKPRASTPSRVFAYILIATLGLPTVLFVGLATFHLLSQNYSFVFQHGNRGLGMVASASLALLILSMMRTGQKAYVQARETSIAVESARQSNLDVPTQLTTANPLTEAFSKHPVTLAAWLPALIVGAFMYATAVTNISMRRLEHTFMLAKSGAHDQLMIEALWTFAVLLLTNVVTGIAWAKLWRARLLEQRTALLNLQEKLGQAKLSATNKL